MSLSQSDIETLSEKEKEIYKKYPHLFVVNENYEQEMKEYETRNKFSILDIWKCKVISYGRIEPLTKEEIDEIKSVFKLSENISLKHFKRYQLFTKTDWDLFKPKNDFNTKEGFEEWIKFHDEEFRKQEERERIEYEEYEKARKLERDFMKKFKILQLTYGGKYNPQLIYNRVTPYTENEIEEIEKFFQIKDTSFTNIYGDKKLEKMDWSLQLQ